MITNGVDWLPISTLADHRIVDRLALVVSDWAGRWFKHAAYGMGEPVPREAGDMKLTAKADWQRYHSNVFFDTDDDLRMALSFVAIDAPRPSPLVESDDRKLLLRYGDNILNDLAASICKVLRVKNDESELPALGEIGCVEFSLSAGKEYPKFRLAVLQNDLVGLRKALIGSPMRAEQESVPVSEAIADHSVMCRAILGKVHLTFGDLQKLEIGDVLVLDRGLDEPLSLCPTNSAVPFCRAKVGQKDREIRLEIQV